MPDGLELFPLDGGKLEIIQELFDAADQEEVDDEDLGHAVMKMYSARYDDIKGMEISEIVEQGREVSINATLEDRQAAEEVILADFDALQASVAKSPKGQARSREGQNHSVTPPISGPDLPRDTVEQTSKASPASKSSKSSSPTHTQTGRKETSFHGSLPTTNNSQTSKTASTT